MTNLAQCEAWRPLRLPGVLVGSGRLGGISATIAAHDALLLRGHDVVAVVVADAEAGGAPELGFRDSESYDVAAVVVADAEAREARFGV